MISRKISITKTHKMKAPFVSGHQRFVIEQANNWIDAEN